MTAIRTYFDMRRAMSRRLAGQKCPGKEYRRKQECQVTHALGPHPRNYLWHAAARQHDALRPSSPARLWSALAGNLSKNWKLNGVIISLEQSDAAYRSDGLSMSVTPVSALRSNADLEFKLEPGPDVHYRGFWDC